MSMANVYLRDALREMFELSKQKPTREMSIAITKTQEALLWLNEMENQYYTEAEVSGE